MNGSNKVCSAVQRSKRDLPCAGQLLRQELLLSSVYGQGNTERKDTLQASQLQEQLKGCVGASHKARCRLELPP